MRCEVTDTPGSLAKLAGTVGRAGGDIQSVEVVGEGHSGHVLDDLVVVGDPDVLRAVVKAIDDNPAVRLVHAGPSRGHPGDAVTRLAIGLEALLSGSSDADRGVTSVIGGLLQATACDLVPAGTAPAEKPTRMVLPFTDRAVVVRRDYPFTDAEHERARSLVRLCVHATQARRPE